MLLLAGDTIEFTSECNCVTVNDEREIPVEPGRRAVIVDKLNSNLYEISIKRRRNETNPLPFLRLKTNENRGRFRFAFHGPYDPAEETPLSKELNRVGFDWKEITMDRMDRETSEELQRFQRVEWNLDR